jgi:quercetin dioxygenase-like cupin family protein
MNPGGKVLPDILKSVIPEQQVDIRADLTQTALVTPDEWQWVDSPQPGVTRVMLDRVGDEVAVATSFVRYAEGSSFPTHQHALGEEFLVLEGEFGDEHGRYPAGTYVRNPAGTSHAPFSEPGCLIWVKLRQFDVEDQDQFALALDMTVPEKGREDLVLHEFGAERVREVVGAAGARITIGNGDEVEEALVVEGELAQGNERLPAWSWLRVPAGASVQFGVMKPTRLLVKTRPVHERD